MKTRILIIIGGIILIVLMTLVNYFSNRPPVSQIDTTSSPPTALPTSMVERLVNPSIPPDNQTQLAIIQTQKLPILNDDFELAYSKLLNKFYIYKKSPQADALILQFFRTNDLSQLIQNNQDLVIYIDEPIFPRLYNDEKAAFPDHPDTQDEDY